MQTIRFNASLPAGFVQDARRVVRIANDAELVRSGRARSKLQQAPPPPPKIVERRTPLAVVPVTPEDLRTRARRLFEALNVGLNLSYQHRQAASAHNLSGGDVCRILATLRELDALKTVPQLKNVFDTETLQFMRRMYEVVQPIQESWQLAMRSMLMEQPGYVPALVCGVNMQTFPARYIRALREKLVQRAAGREDDIIWGDYILHPQAARKAFEIPEGAFDNFLAAHQTCARLALQFDDHKIRPHLQGFANAFAAVEWRPPGV